jgi:hypothetical protein
VALGTDGATVRSRRTSYVIGRDGRIKLVYANMDYRDHVKLTLARRRRLAGKISSFTRPFALGPARGPLLCGQSV